MKKIVLFLSALVLSTSVFAQKSVKWEDPYLKPDAPGYEDLQKAAGYLEVGDTGGIGFKRFEQALEGSCIGS